MTQPPGFPGPPPWPQWAPPPPPPPASHRRPPRKWHHGKLGALVLLVGGLGVACLVASPTSPQSAGSAPATRSTYAAPPRATTTTAPAATTALALPSTPARKITAREWQLIAKNPDAHIGDTVIVYGQVTQFDAATGTTAFRANADGVEHKPAYGYADYSTNTLFAGDAAVLRDIVEGDLFKAEAIVVGATSYDTQIGGATTAPQLSVTKIDIIGHV